MRPQIIGGRLEQGIKEFGIDAVKVFETTETKHLEPYQVWEMNENEFDKLSMIEDVDWTPVHGWWRHGSSVFDDYATQDFTINGHSIQAYEIREPDEEGEEDLRDNEFPDLFTYFEYVLGVTAPYKKVYVANSLAKENNMSLATLLEVYQG